MLEPAIHPAKSFSDSLLSTLSLLSPPVFFPRTSRSNPALDELTIRCPIPRPDTHTCSARLRVSNQAVYISTKPKYGYKKPCS
ncbi:hypothetical protein AOQ84DRAFT_354985 [Glonium stellatum]|uniref:Uncharacterized protein n=1 Tax=Glonium stellatum TaxID=574774 RepID=A0A8E2JS48_9PEZI|nr:hypothetical protein AOQ84DRAFT_354985 [Glonium stellatum]